MLISNKSNLSIYRRLRKLSAWLIACIIIAVILVLLGWLCNIDFLKRPLSGGAAMNPTTAILFLLLSLSFTTIIYFDQPKKFNSAGLILAAFIMLVGLLSIAGLWNEQLSNIDKIIFAERLVQDLSNGAPNRMAGSTATCFVLCGFSLLMLGLARRRALPVQVPVLIAGSISLLSLIGYIYRVREFSGILRYFPMSVQTAACFLFFSFAFLIITPDRGIMQDLTGNRTGSITARRLIPFALIVPVLLGWLRLLGAWSGIFSIEFGVSILVLSIIFCFVFVVWYNAILLNKRDASQEQIQVALKENERRFKSLISSIRDYAIFMIDPSGNIMSWNIGAQTIKGYSEEEAIGQPISIFYTPEDVENGVPAYNLDMARRHGHYNAEGWRVRKDGSRFWADVVFTPLYDEAHRLEGFAKVTRDITERRMAEQKIAYQARLMEDSTDAVFSLDNGFSIVSWNRAAEALYGYTPQEAVGAVANDLLVDPTTIPIRAIRRKSLQELGYWTGEVMHLTKSGTALYLLLSASAIRDPEGRFDGYVVVCRDITDRKKAEDQLRRFNEVLAEQVQEKTEELASVFDRLSEGFMEIGENGEIIYANRMAAVMNKKEGEELAGRNFWRLFPTAAGNEFGKYFREALATQENRHFEMFSPSLKMWIECAMYPTPRGVSFFFRDITERWNARDTINRSNQELRDLAAHLQVVREEERAEMAREIHDELGQQLTGLKMDMSWLAKRLQTAGNDAVIKRMKSTQELLNHTVMTVRKLASQLRPSILDDLGLVAAIEWQGQEFEKRSGIKTSFQASANMQRFPPDMSIGLFRICQEALTNVARHSGAKHVGICLIREDELLVLKIVDDGKGLPKDSPGSQKKTLGLVGMKERAMMMGGTVDIQSEEGKGLTVTVTVPLTMTNI